MSKEDPTASPKGENAAHTLSDAEIVTGPVMGRRAAITALGTVTLGATATASVAMTGCIVRTAQPAYVAQPQPTYVVQQQPGYVAQPAYQRAYSGVTDGDAGAYADAAGYGRGSYRGVQTGITDSDNGTGGIQDPAGQGRGHHGYPGWQSGITDSDSGSYADPAGNGRGTARSGSTGLTDSDGGRYADPAGGGRGRWR